MIRYFNCFGETQVYSLQTQIRYFLTNIFRAQQYTPEQLGFGPSLAVCGKIKEAKTKVDLEEHIPFVEIIYKMEFDTVFTVPEVEASNKTALKKQKRDKRLETFE